MCLDTSHISGCLPVCLETPICLDAPHVGHPHMFGCPHMFGHPLHVWMPPVCLETPYVWMPHVCTPPVCLDATPYVWNAPVCLDIPHMFGCPMFRWPLYNLTPYFVRLGGCPYAPNTFVHPHMFGHPPYVCLLPICLDTPCTYTRQRKHALSD